MLKKGFACFLQIVRSETEATQVSRFVRAMRVVRIEQIVGEFRLFNERIFRIGQPHAAIDKRAAKSLEAPNDRRIVMRSARGELRGTMRVNEQEIRTYLCLRG